MFSTRNVAIALIALSFFLVAVGLEHPFFHVVGEEKSLVFSQESIVAISRELSFALIIALIISIGIEKEARKEDLESANALRKEVSLDVFRGVFSRKLPIEYVDLAIEKTLLSPTLRTYYQEIISIEEFTSEELVGSGIGRLAKLRVATSYKIQNVTQSNRMHKVMLSIPVGNNLYRKYIGLDSLKISAERFSKEKISEIFHELEERLEYACDVSMSPDQIIEIQMEYVLIKEISDSEVTLFAYPTLEADISLHVGMDHLKAGLFTKTASPIQLTYTSFDKRDYRWRISGPCLPNDTLMFWWHPD